MPLDAGIGQLLALYHPSGRQGNKKKQQSINDSKKVAELMAVAIRRYVTAHIVQWRRLRAF
jgi:hypothetical protein